MAVHHESIRGLARAIGKMPAELRLELRPKLRKGGDIVAAEAKANAGAWSSRIPGAISVSSNLSASRGGVVVRVSSKRAPHARPYEGLAKGGTRDSFRAPLFGDREHWYSHATRPFLMPALRAKRDAVKDVIREAVRTATRL